MNALSSGTTGKPSSSYCMAVCGEYATCNNYMLHILHKLEIVFAIRSEGFRKMLSHACILHMMLTNILYNFVLLLSSYLKHFWVVHYDSYAIFQQIELYRIFLIKALWGSNTIWTFLFVCLLFTLTWYQFVKTMYYNIWNASTIEKKIIS